MVISLLFLILPQLYPKRPPRRAAINGHIYNDMVGWIVSGVRGTVYTGLDLFHQFAVLTVDAEPVAAVVYTTAPAHCGFDPQFFVLIITGNGRDVLVYVALVGRKEQN